MTWTLTECSGLHSAATVKTMVESNLGEMAFTPSYSSPVIEAHQDRNSRHGWGDDRGTLLNDLLARVMLNLLARVMLSFAC